MSCCFFVISFVIVHFLYKKHYINLLSYIVFVIFALPWIHIPPYLFFNFNTKVNWLWGLAVKPYMVDERVIELTAMLGTTGCLGLVTGFLVTSSLIHTKDKKELQAPTLNMVRLNATTIFMLLCFGLFFSIISTPTETLLEAVYTESSSIVEGKGFDSAWMVGYIVITYAYCDSWLDRTGRAGALKRKLCFGTILYVLIVLQLARGDREALPWIAAIIACPYFCSRIFSDMSEYKIKPRMLIFLIFSVLIINYGVGYLRIYLVGLSPIDTINLIIQTFSSGEILFSNLFTGTWSAVLLTPLSVAGDYIYGETFSSATGKLYWGLDYWNLFASLPPGFVANWFGYVRPLDGLTGPAWEMRYGQGGVHAVILPFRNFSIIGVFFIPVIIAGMICKIEAWAMKNISVYSLSLVLVLIMAAPHWLWYGEKALINAIIIWFFAGWVYRCIFSLWRLLIKSRYVSVSS